MLAMLDFVATFEFALSGCIQAGKRSAVLAPFAGFFCSFFGGLIRDLLLYFLVSPQVVPAFFSAHQNWISAALAIITYGIISFTKKESVLNTKGTIRFLRVIDLTGTALFVVAGILRSIEAGACNEVALFCYGVLSSIGGGLFSLITIFPNKIATLKANLPYYVMVTCFSLWVCETLDKEMLKNEIAIFALCMIFATFGMNVLPEPGALHYSHFTNGTGMARKLGFYFSRGALFSLVSDPQKGVHLSVINSRRIGVKSRCPLVFSVA